MKISKAKILQHIRKTSYGHIRYERNATFGLVNCPTHQGHKVTVTTDLVKLSCQIGAIRIDSSNGRVLPGHLSYRLSAMGSVLPHRITTGRVLGSHFTGNLRSSYFPDLSFVTEVHVHVDDKQVFTMLGGMATVFAYSDASMRITVYGKWLELESFVAKEKEAIRRDTRTA